MNDAGSSPVCFKVFDCDGDGLLDRGEMTRATELLKRLREENTPDERERSGTLEEEEGERGQTQVYGGSKGGGYKGQ